MLAFLYMEKIMKSYECNQFENRFVFVTVLWIAIEVTDFSIYFIFQFKQYKNANISNFLYYGKTRLLKNFLMNNPIPGRSCTWS